MAKISALDFANNVEHNRKKLRQHCLKHGKEVSESESLDIIVATNDEISTSTPDGYFKVEFKDLNGDYFAPTQYVQAGGSAVLPSGYPELEPDILEFVEWTCSGDLNNVQDNLVCLPQYQTKASEVANQRPTILKCYFNENTLSPTLKFSTRTNTYINWGDGSPTEQVASGTISHTYANVGLYTITVYGDKYSFTGSSTIGMFSSSSYSSCLLYAYMGENVSAIENSSFRGNSSLINVVLPSTINAIGNNAFDGCYGLKSIVMPNGITSIGSNAFHRCIGLNSVVLPNGLQTILSQAFYNNYGLRSILIPNTVNTIENGAFSSCYSLESLTIPSSVTTLNPYIIISNYSLRYLNLFQDFDTNFDFRSTTCLETESLIDIANKLKDNTGLLAHTLTIHYASKPFMSTIYLDQFGKRVPYNTEGAVSLLEFIQNKNWTVSFNS